MHLLFLRTGNRYNLLAELVRDVPQSGSHLSGALLPSASILGRKGGVARSVLSMSVPSAITTKP